MEKTMAFWTIEMSAKFKDKEEGIKYANRLINKFDELCRINNDYKAQIIIGISSLNGKRIESAYRNNGKIERVFSDDEVKKRRYGKLNQKWHMHILALTEPSETFARLIKDYINKNWQVKAYIKYKGYKDNELQYFDVGYLVYIAKQSEVVRFYCSDDKKFNGNSLKELYNEYLRVQKLVNNSSYIINGEDKKYNGIRDYFNSIVEDKIKRVNERKVGEENIFDELDEVQKSNYEKNIYDDYFEGFE